MKVFLSHAIHDKELVNKLKKKCREYGLELLIAEHSYAVDKSITQKIESMIKESKIALFLLTAKGNESKFVQQEIGYAKSLNKPSIYLVQIGSETTGFAYGHDYIEFDPEQPDIAIKKAISLMVAHWNKLIEKQKEENKVFGLLFGGLIGLALLSD